jgi:hypothetical protein
MADSDFDDEDLSAPPKTAQEIVESDNNKAIEITDEESDDDEEKSLSERKRKRPSSRSEESSFQKRTTRTNDEGNKLEWSDAEESARAITSRTNALKKSALKPKATPVRRGKQSTTGVGRRRQIQGLYNRPRALDLGIS